jgi:hypothetical protein
LRLRLSELPQSGGLGEQCSLLPIHLGLVWDREYREIRGLEVRGRLLGGLITVMDYTLEVGPFIELRSVRQDRRRQK